MLKHNRKEFTRLVVRVTPPDCDTVALENFLLDHDIVYVRLRVSRATVQVYFREAISRAQVRIIFAGVLKFHSSDVLPPCYWSEMFDGWFPLAGVANSLTE